MNKPKGKRTAAANKQRGEARSALSLAAASRMLPLVSGVVKDIQHRWQHLAELETEQGDLERRRHKLPWPQRARRYQVVDDIASEQRHLQAAVAELEQLSVVLVDPVAGEVAFPTVINGRRAYFVWRLNEADLARWCYAHETTRHAIPASWRE